VEVEAVTTVVAVVVRVVIEPQLTLALLQELLLL
jgi:hypothetical protein